MNQGGIFVGWTPEEQEAIYGRDEGAPDQQWAEFVRRYDHRYPLQNEPGGVQRPPGRSVDPPGHKAAPGSVGSVSQGLKDSETGCRGTRPSCHQKGFLENLKFGLQQFPIEHLGFFTGTFATSSPGPEHLKLPRGVDRAEWWQEKLEARRERVQSMSDLVGDLFKGPVPSRPYRVGDLVTDYARVFECREDDRGGFKANCFHVHAILVMNEPISVKSMDRFWDWRKARQERKYGEASRLEKEVGFSPVLVEFMDRLRASHKAARNKRKKRQGKVIPGVFEIRPCYQDPGDPKKEKLANYLAGYFCKGGRILGRPEGLEGMRFSALSQGWPRKYHGLFKSVDGLNEVTRERGRKFSELIGVPFEQMREYFGPRWSWVWGPTLRRVNIDGSRLWWLYDKQTEGWTEQDLEILARHPERRGFRLLGPPIPPEGFDWPGDHKGPYAWNVNETVRWLISGGWKIPFNGEVELYPDLIPPSERIPF